MNGFNPTDPLPPSPRRGRCLTILTRSIPAHGPGGMERATWLLAEGLVDRGWRVRILTTKVDPARVPAKAGLEVCGIPGAAAQRYGSAFAAGIRAALADTAPGEVVLSVSAAGFDYLKLAPRRRHPVALVCHGTSWDEIQSKWKSPSFRAWAGLARQLTWIPKDIAAYRRAECIITVNDPITTQIARLLPPGQRRKITTIYNGTAPGAAGATGRAAGDRRLVVCTSGRLVREKGIHLLLQACARLPVEQRPEEVWICGDGPALPALRKLAGDLALTNVNFTGHIKEVAPYLQRASVLVLPSLRMEGLPMSVLEALAVGCPAIIPTSLQFPNVGQPGLLRFAAGDAADLARALAAAREHGRHAGLVPELTLDAMIDRYHAVLLRLSVAASRATAHPLVATT